MAHITADPILNNKGRLRSAVHIMSDITERRQAEEKIRQKHEQLRGLARQLTETEERERKHIARELHDQIGQNLTAIGINLSIIQSQIPALMESPRSRLQDTLGLLEQTTERARNLMSELRPPALDEFGLAVALRWRVQSFSVRLGIPIGFTADDAFPRLATDKEVLLFRIAEEALTNISKHADATRTTVTLVSASAAVRMVIADNGKGFDASTADVQEGKARWGIATITERARLAGGSISIRSGPGRGTELIVELPA